MLPKPRKSLEETEVDVRRLTAVEHRAELRLIEDLLSSYLKGFGLLGSFKRDNDLHYAWLLLTTRSFNSLRSAFVLLSSGYYDQAIVLIRSVEEDWLTAVDCQNNPETLEALLHRQDKRMPPYADMAKRISPEFYEKPWKYNYGSLSTVAHARERALRILVDPDTKNLRLGAAYDRVLFLGVCHALLRSAILMLDFLAKILGEKASEWKKETLPKREAASEWCAALAAKVDADQPV